MISLHPLLRYLAPLVPLLMAGAVYLFVLRRRRAARALGEAHLVRRLSGVDLTATPWLRVVLVVGAAAALGMAIADPRWGAAAPPAQRRSGPVTLVVDVSNSMLAADVTPSRLARAKVASARLVDRLHGAPVGLVAFAGRAFALTPPTTDPGALDLYLQALDPQMVTQTGSSVSGAIRQGVSLLLAGREKAGALVLISDGDALEEQEAIREAARLAGRAGIPVFTLGVGTAGGSPVPDIDFRTGRQVGFKREPTGQVAISTLRAEVLREIARESGGAYLTLDGEEVTSELAARLGAVSGAGGAGSGAPEAPARYAWFATAALLLLLAEAFVGRAVREARA